MRTQCCVIGCKNYTHNRKGKRLDNGVQFFTIPAWRQHNGEQISELTKRRRMAWVSAIKQPDITFNSTAKHFVCSQHFLTGKPANEMLDSDTDWTPTLRMGHTEEEASLINAKRLSQRTRTLEPVIFTASAEPAPQTPEADKVLPPPPSTTCDESGAASQEPEVDKELNKEFNSWNLNGRDDINRLLQNYRSEKKNLSQRQFDEDYFKGNDEGVKYYTGLQTFDMLMVMMEAVRLYMQTDKKLSKFQQFVLTLMRLRLDWPNVHLAQMFCIDPETAATIFKNTINVVYSEVGMFLLWPIREDVRDNLPHQFEDVLGKRYALIIDCFEIATEMPSVAISHSKKHQHTQKFVIGIAPYGAPTYVSQGYEGDFTDMTVTGLCGILQKLQPGDVVVADRGFNIEESVGLMCAKVNRHRRLDKIRVEQTQKMADLRSHVRAIVDNVRNRFSMLNHTIPACFCLPCEGEGTTWLDKIVHVCCLFTGVALTDYSDVDMHFCDETKELVYSDETKQLAKDSGIFAIKDNKVVFQGYPGVSVGARWTPAK